MFFLAQDFVSRDSRSSVTKDDLRRLLHLSKTAPATGERGGEREGERGGEVEPLVE